MKVSLELMFLRNTILRRKALGQLALLAETKKEVGVLKTKPKETYVFP